MLALFLLAACSPTPAEKPAAKNDPPAMQALARPVPPPVTDNAATETLNETAAAEPAAPAVYAALAPDLPASNDADEPKPFPSAVTAFMVDRDGCDHFRGEEPYDEDRRVFLEENIRQLCTGTDARLAKLRKRYADNPDVIAALAQYEDKIEAPEDQGER